MLPGYGFSPFPDFQPHLHAIHCRGEPPSMWIPGGSAESQSLSEAKEDRRLIHPCHHKHVAVCQQETLAFIELQPPVTHKLNGFGSSRPTVIPHAHCTAHSQPPNGCRQTLNERTCHRTDSEHGTNLNLNSHTLTAGDGERECQNGIRTSLQEETERPRTVTTVCRPLHAALSLPLSFPLSSLYTNRDSLESQLPSSPECPSFQGPDSCQLQRRTSHSSLKEKSIRECEALFCFWGFFLVINSLTCFLLI